MLNVTKKLQQTLNRDTSIKAVFKSEDGAIDLASIMVGIIVIGLIGGVIAATVFAVIPWSQDNAAKQQLDSVVAAESAYMGLSSTNPPSLPTGLAGNSYGSSAELETAGLLKTGPKYCASTINTGTKGYEVFVQSSSGKIFSATDKVTKPVLFTGTLPTDCQFITAGTATEPVAYVDPTPKLTVLTYNCDTTTTGRIPIQNSMNGTETWDDGIVRTYAGASTATDRTLTAGVTYKMTFDGTYSRFSSWYDATTLSKCLVSMDHWGSETGVVSAEKAFNDSIKLTSVPTRIPSTITNTSGMFFGATNFNQDISSWDISNVTMTYDMFRDAKSFNQPLNNWNMSKVYHASSMFSGAIAFNQPLDKWNTSNMEQMASMFNGASKFNQNINDWSLAKAKNIYYMFSGASSFNQPLDKWDTSNITDLSMMFYNARDFNQDVSSWNVSRVTVMEYTFAYTNKFNKPLNSWNTANVTRMAGMFNGAYAFNQPLNNWDTSKVTGMSYMFNGTSVFNQNIKTWNVASVTSSDNFRLNSALTAENSPF